MQVGEAVKLPVGDQVTLTVLESVGVRLCVGRCGDGRNEPQRADCHRGDRGRVCAQGHGDKAWCAVSESEIVTP